MWRQLRTLLFLLSALLCGTAAALWQSPTGLSGLQLWQTGQTEQTEQNGQTSPQPQAESRTMPAEPHQPSGLPPHAAVALPPTTTPVVVTERDHFADLHKKYQSAVDSNDLYVSPQFDFAMHRQVHIDVTVRDPLGRPMADVRVSLSGITAAQSGNAVEDIQGALLQSARTNAQGRADMPALIPAGVEHLLVDLQVIGIANRRMLSLQPENNRYEVVFQP